jgi:hypothetical protein
MLGVLHYDLRPDTPSTTNLLAAAWLLATSDGVSFAETPVGDAFDLAAAPDAGGLFLGDYQGLSSGASGFVPFFALATGDPANRTDVYAHAIDVPAVAAGRDAAAYRARPAPTRPVADEARERLRRSDLIVQAMEQRVPGWAARVGAQRPGSGAAAR